MKEEPRYVVCSICKRGGGTLTKVDKEYRHLDCQKTKWKTKEEREKDAKTITPEQINS
jgi:hypothetical protein